MKEPTRGPIFACMYPGLCDVARKHGYALTIHGSLVTDMDLVAIPWTDAAVPAEELMQVFMDHLHACDFESTLRRDGTSEDHIKQIMERPESRHCEVKPHGRKAWNLYLLGGTKVDLSIMPRVQAL